jgi:hypothetical protein
MLVKHGLDIVGALPKGKSTSTEIERKSLSDATTIIVLSQFIQPQLTLLIIAVERQSRPSVLLM